MPKCPYVEDEEKEILKDPLNVDLVKRLNKLLNEKRQEETLEELEAKFKAFKPECAKNFTRFDQFPISRRTLRGLADAGFVNPTEIQRQSLGYSLTGRDVIGAAKTGSGKTLALIIPLLECLYRNSWSRTDGLGALVICPTRELSYQIFKVINDVGGRHQFSVALLIGGTNVEYEKKRLATMNIVICTPGRLLHHMDENECFTCDQLQMLIIDEADRILDMGFQRQMDSIIENLPKQRQTLLFSATQTKRVEDLSRVSLKDPVDVSVHANDEKATPDKLEQTYFVCEEHEKINMLWSFLKTHLRQKTLVFVTCCKQARYLTESLRHLKPGLSLMGLWGDMLQTKRLETFQKFDANQRGAAMIATDVASRGLDFRNIDWVLQLDCPADVDDYIHRVGRTARFENRGRATLVLTPSQEKSFVDLLTKRKIPITRYRQNNNRLTDIRLKLSNLMVPFPQLKEFAQRSIVAYARAIYFMKLKSVFDVKTINFEELASSYGLPLMPRIRFLQRKGVLPARRPHDFVPRFVEGAKSCAVVEEIVLTDGGADIAGEWDPERKRILLPNRKSFIGKEEVEKQQKNERQRKRRATMSDENEEAESGQFGAKSSTISTTTAAADDVNEEDEKPNEIIEQNEADEEEADDDNFLRVARRDVFNVLKGATLEDEIGARIFHNKKDHHVTTKHAFAKKILKRGIRLNKRIKFEDNGEASDHENKDNGNANGVGL